MAGQGPSGHLSIDDILAHIRTQLADRAPAAVTTAPAAGRRGSVVSVPYLTAPDDRALIPAGRDSYGLEEFLGLEEETFLQNAYRVVLGRDVDMTGRAHYLPLLLAGKISEVRILAGLRRSPEGRAQGATIRGLLPALVLDQFGRLPLIRPLTRPLAELAALPRTLQGLRRRHRLAETQHQELISAANAALGAVRKSLVRLERLLEEGADRPPAGAAADTRSALAEARQLLADQARQIGLLVARSQSAPGTPPPDLAAHAHDALYLALENRFRGAPEEIAARSARYLPLLAANPAVAEGGVVLDIGCGRGEWLAQLGEAGIAARGIDLNASMAEAARARGLDAVAGDAIQYLQEAPAGQLGAVTGFHIAEHLPFDVLVALLDAAHRALRPGGVILLETPNPENLVVAACTFHYDPTHNRPLPPELMRFLAEARGFEATRIIRKDADCDLDEPESGFVPGEVNDWFRQPADYALYAQKPAARVPA